MTLNVLITLWLDQVAQSWMFISFFYGSCFDYFHTGCANVLYAVPSVSAVRILLHFLPPYMRTVWPMLSVIFPEIDILFLVSRCVKLSIAAHWS